MLIDLKPTDEEKKLVKEFWPIFDQIHARSCTCADTAHLNQKLWATIKLIAEDAFRLGRLVGRDEVLEHQEQVACDHQFVYNREGGVCASCGQTSLKCSS